VLLRGGRYPRWGRSGSDELYCLSADGAMMAVSVKLSPTLALGPTKKLFDWRKPIPGVSGLLYDVAPDGRFLMTKATAPNPDRQTNVSLILNWLTGVRTARQ
jgi:hypothetical protein